MSLVTAGKSTRTVVNHFVAQFTSKPWLMGRNHFDRLSMTKSGVRATRVGPKNWGSERGLYSQNVEDAFGKIESKLAYFHRKLECEASLSSDERYGWSMWLLSSYLRTPSAFLCSAEASEIINDCSADKLFETSYSMLAQCVTNPHLIELVANRNWQILTSDKPYFLKPDSGVVLTDRLDSDDCLILYPISPNVCFLATGIGHGFERASVQIDRVFELNNGILRWSENSVVCTSRFWEEEELKLCDAVRTNLAGGKYSPPTSGRFFAVEGVECDKQIRAMVLAPRGPIVMTVPASAVRPVDGVERPVIPGLYDVEDAPIIPLEVRFSDDESEIDYAAAAQVMMRIGQTKLAVEFAGKALQKDKNDLLSKLVVLANEPSLDAENDLIPENADEAAELAFWWALARRKPIEGLKITSSWLKHHPDHRRLAQANFYCALLVHGPKLLQALLGSNEQLAYLNDSTPLPEGLIELIKRGCAPSDTGTVSEIQSQVGKIDVKTSGLATDILKLCGLGRKVRLYRKE
jgi:hypothetical protein